MLYADINKFSKGLYNNDYDHCYFWYQQKG